MGQCCGGATNSDNQNNNTKTDAVTAPDWYASKLNAVTQKKSTKMKYGRQGRLSQLKLKRGVFKLKIDENRIRQSILEKMSLKADIAKIGSGGYKPVSGKMSNRFTLSNMPSCQRGCAHSFKGEFRKTHNKRKTSSVRSTTLKSPKNCEEFQSVLSESDDNLY